MPDNLPKHSGSKLKWWQKEIKFPKLEWWHKGALIGSGWATITSFFILFAAGTPGPGGGVIILFLELPIFPIFFFFGPSLNVNEIKIFFLLVHFIGWTLGGVFYASVFRLIVKLFRKDKKQ